MVDQLRSSTAIVTSVAREVGTDGKNGRQARCLALPENMEATLRQRPTLWRVT